MTYTNIHATFFYLFIHIYTRFLTAKLELIKYKKSSEKISFDYLESLPLPLTNLSAAFVNNTIYIAGGDSKEGSSHHFYSLDLSLPGAGWHRLPDIPVKIAFAVMAAQSNGINNCIWLMGGRCKKNNGISVLHDSAYQFDLKNNQWLQKKSLPYKLSAGTGLAIGSKGILLFSGDNGETFSKVEELNAAISNETDVQKKQALVEKKISILTSHPGFAKDVLLYNTHTNLWQKMSTIPFDAPVTTTAFKWGADIVIPGGEIKAGVRTPQILMGTFG